MVLLISGNVLYGIAAFFENCGFVKKWDSGKIVVLVWISAFIAIVDKE